MQVSRAKGVHDKAADLLWVVGPSATLGQRKHGGLPHLLSGEEVEGGCCKTERGGGAQAAAPSCGGANVSGEPGANCM